MIPNVGKCKLCGYNMTSEEYINHMILKHNKEWNRCLTSVFEGENKK